MDGLAPFGSTRTFEVAAQSIQVYCRERISGGDDYRAVTILDEGAKTSRL
jgi:hypothetical protein